MDFMSLKRYGGIAQVQICKAGFRCFRKNREDVMDGLHSKQCSSLNVCR